MSQIHTIKNFDFGEEVAAGFVIINLPGDTGITNAAAK